MRVFIFSRRPQYCFFYPIFFLRIFVFFRADKNFVCGAVRWGDFECKNLIYDSKFGFRNYF